MIRRVLGLGIVAMLLLGASGSAAAPLPEGPRLAFLNLHYALPRADLLTVDATGAFPVRIAGGGPRARFTPDPTSRPTWSPDGGLIAFAAVPRKLKGPGGTRLFAARPDGTGLRRLPGGRGGYEPVFAPDGRSLVFTRFNRTGATVWELDLATGRERRLTPVRKGLSFFPSSFSPDGSALALTRIDENLGFDAVVLWLANGNVELLAAEAGEPMFSPDGSKIALIREYFRGPSLEETTDIYLLERGRLPLRRLTRTPRTSESSPTWDPSASRLAYVRATSSGSSLATQLGLGSAVMEINSDGSCPRKLVSYPHAVVYGPAWQPGPGRGAGRIECGG